MRQNGIVQFKGECICILQRKWKYQVEFIVAFEDITRAETMTLAPLLARVFVVASPIPEVAPVTNATFPSNMFMTFTIVTRLKI
jgi:hypothetical protein